MKKAIINMDSVREFLKEEELTLTETDYKWVLEDQPDIFHFKDDIELIDWCEEQRQQIEEAKEE